MCPVGPLCSTGIAPLLSSYWPRRLPAGPGGGYAFPPPVGFRPTAGSPRFLIRLSAGAVPNHPGEPCRCTCSSLPCRRRASSPLEGWPTPSCFTRPNRVHLRYGSRLRLPGPRPFGCPQGRPVDFMVDEQLPWWTPFIPRDGPGLAWRTKAAKTQRRTQRPGESTSLAVVQVRLERRPPSPRHAPPPRRCPALPTGWWPWGRR